MKGKKLYLRAFKRFSKDILADRTLKKINSYDDLLIKIKDYYNHEFTVEMLKIKLISVKTKRRTITKNMNYTLLVTLVSLFISVCIGLYNMSSTLHNKSSDSIQQEISQTDTYNENYNMKIMDIDYQISISNDNKQKAALEKYKNNLQREVDNNNAIKQSYLNDLASSYKEGPYIFFEASKVVLIYLMTMAVFFIIENIHDDYKELQRIYLDDTAMIIEQLIEEKQNEPELHYKEIVCVHNLIKKF